ncbi:hypothetical protein [Streptomyces sp. RKAG293]|uniref:hypothetical protein n=1 Tax=Streptomyces sp. RKAG293 TaxID=2893403 RepID=UPI0020337548|nr:hypothetical protein [Streptomyces sp. RKAG293]MCM2422179.1 hypothetical protein [Streptomyces sp. RKAG293]
MPRGRTCQVCRQRMTVKSEQRQPKGSWVVYECQNPACRNYLNSGRLFRFSEKIFEDN